MYYVIATPGKAIVTIHSISQGEHGGLRIEQEYEVIGPNMALRMGRKIDNEIFIYNEDTTGSVLEGIFNRYALKNSGTSQGSIEMGECPPDQMLKTPIRIELKRGDRIVIATCIFKDGRKSELFFSCN